VLLLNPNFTKAYNRRVVTSPDEFGYLIAPGIRGIRAPIADGAIWALDNGAYSGTSPQKFLRLADTYRPHTGTCLFAVALDTVSDHAATLRAWPNWRNQLAHRGYKVAFAAQDGCTVDTVPWAELGALFIGGSDEFKDRLSVPIIREAKERGIWVHVGRVNWRRRVHFCLSLGVDSIDGTGFARAPKRRLAEFDRWVGEWKQNGRLL
jgi:hypothetical protein